MGASYDQKDAHGFINLIGLADSGARRGHEEAK